MKGKLVVLLVFMSLIINYSCSNNIQDKPDEKIVLFYKNGNKFCEGIHRVSQSGNKEIKHRKGIWKFYYLNGSIMLIYEYDEDGNAINVKEYNENGKLLYSEVTTKNSINEIRYYENGNVDYESITKIVEEHESGDNEPTEIYYETLNEYYPNGELKSQIEFVDNVRHGKTKIWDETGTLMIEIEYDNGFIKNQ